MQGRLRVAIPPRYQDLFEELCDPDQVRADRAYDSILFDRGEAVPHIIEFYPEARRNAKLRYLLIQLLSFSGDKRAIPSIVSALKDNHPIVRAEACNGLEDLKARQHVTELESMLDDDDPRVRESAEEALKALQR